jgi:uncharacterized membrane protein YfcA
VFVPDFTITAAFELAALGFAVGVVGTLVGAGGGFILTPVLLLLYPHSSAQTITAISIGVVFFNALSGSIAYRRQRRTDYRSGMVFALATLPGAVIGALVVGVVRRSAFNLIKAGVLLTLGLWLLSIRRSNARAQPGGAHRLLTDAAGVTYDYDVRLARGAAISVVVGFLSSFLGIGGGVIHVPLLVQALGFPVHVATATSHFVLVFMSGAATITHAIHGSYQLGSGLRRTLALSAGVIAGAQLGAHLSLRMSARTIQTVLSLALIAIAIRLALSA